MIDPKTLLPMVKRLLPNESDQDLMAGIQQFAKEHPDLGNKEALQALIDTLKEMQGGKQAQPTPTPAKPFGEGLMGQLGSI